MTTTSHPKRITKVKVPDEQGMNQEDQVIQRNHVAFGKTYRTRGVFSEEGNTEKWE